MDQPQPQELTHEALVEFLCMTRDVLEAQVKELTMEAPLEEVRQKVDDLRIIKRALGDLI